MEVGQGPNWGCSAKEIKYRIWEILLKSMFGVSGFHVGSSFMPVNNRKKCVINNLIIKLELKPLDFICYRVYKVTLVAKEHGLVYSRVVNMQLNFQ
jgi:hypothetical protein